MISVSDVNGASPKIVDSVKLSDEGEGKIELQVKAPSVFLLTFTKRKQMILIVLPGEKIEIFPQSTPSGNSIIVTGSPETALYQQYERATEQNLYKVDSLSAKFSTEQSKPDFSKIKAKLDSAYLLLFNQQKEMATTFINSHPQSLASWVVLGSSFGPNPLFSNETDPDLFLKLNSSLSAHYPDAEMLKPLQSIVRDIVTRKSENARIAKLLAPGQPLPEIILPSADGKLKSTGSFRGKVVLVYFWNSWSAPSRQLNLQLAAYYPQWKKKGLEIFAISLDTDEILWRNACQLDKAYWINVFDKRGLESDLASQFGIKKLPSLVLIDRSGKIISQIAAAETIKSVESALNE